MNDDEIIENLRMVAPPNPYAWVWVVGFLLLALLLAAGAWWYYVRARKSALAGIPGIPPERTALESLARIRHLIEEGKHREFVIEVSGILRFYIEGRFGLTAPRLSTEEFLHLARDSEELGPERREMLADFLRKCDRVKFALAGMAKEGMEDLYASAEQFVRQTATPAVVPIQASPAVVPSQATPAVAPIQASPAVAPSNAVADAAAEVKTDP